MTATLTWMPKTKPQDEGPSQRCGAQTPQGDPNASLTKSSSPNQERISPVTETPKAYQDTISSPEGKHWQDSMDYELNKLEEMDTWKEINKIDIPQEAQVLPGMWVHLIKNLESGE